MTEAQVLALINQFIIANGNNEITANVLRPILVAMLQQPNDKVGELPDLNTTDKSNIVAAINELINNGTAGFAIHAGSADPNVTPPASYSIGDWYIRGGNSLYQYNGQRWVLLTSGGAISSDAGNDLTLGTDGYPYFEERTPAEIKTAYESNSDTNAFTDADQATLGSALQSSDLDPYLTENESDARYILNQEKGATDGVATLGSDGKLTLSQRAYKEITIDGNLFRYVGDDMANIQINDIAAGGKFTYQSTLFFGDLKCINNTGDLTTGIGTKWQPINLTQL